VICQPDKSIFSSVVFFSLKNSSALETNDPLQNISSKTIFLLSSAQTREDGKFTAKNIRINTKNTFFKISPCLNYITIAIMEKESTNLNISKEIDKWVRN
jgi:hypothetical protein